MITAIMIGIYLNAYFTLCVGWQIRLLRLESIKVEVELK